MQIPGLGNGRLQFLQGKRSHLPILTMSASRNACPTIQNQFGMANLANAKRGPLVPGFPECNAIFPAPILLAVAIGQNNQVAIANQRLVFCARAA
jgi:hypothetical protein